ncbi:MAG TPA: peptide-methionine (R)-S-oxide reductase MsrB [Candidatus Paceibacterota bacterium]|jgi:peptide-methionine (R)-S-oxide reductase|nr:peptide-methionine (R)-S-oxide reductase MsrB [Candidatus Paceibacterota bacterium]
MTDKIIKTEEEWKEELTPEQYHVLREKGTETRFDGKYVNEHANGVYHCAACNNPLFSSSHKYDSKSGWPSFDEALPGAVEYKEDASHGMSRVEVVCARCGSHLGHVFPDGPEDTTGQRFCMNSISLDLQKE